MHFCVVGVSIFFIFCHCPDQFSFFPPNKSTAIISFFFLSRTHVFLFSFVSPRGADKPGAKKKKKKALRSH